MKAAKNQTPQATSYRQDGKTKTVVTHAAWNGLGCDECRGLGFVSAEEVKA